MGSMLLGIPLNVKKKHPEVNFGTFQVCLHVGVDNETV